MNANVIIRGLRAVSDFEYELQIAQANHKLNRDVETIFLATSTHYPFVSSSVVKEIARYGADISRFAPECIVGDIYKKFK
jgi:pantetheine-phosphate adenylyltransferase